jgi:hypothetical protein
MTIVGGNAIRINVMKAAGAAVFLSFVMWRYFTVWQEPRRAHLLALVSTRATSRRSLVLIKINDGLLIRPELVFSEG